MIIRCDLAAEERCCMGLWSSAGGAVRATRHTSNIKHAAGRCKKPLHEHGGDGELHLRLTVSYSCNTQNARPVFFLTTRLRSGNPRHASDHVRGAEGARSLSYLKKQIISGSAPLPCGTCSSLPEMILSAGREKWKKEKRGWGATSCNIPFECLQLILYII